MTDDESAKAQDEQRQHYNRLLARFESGQADGRQVWHEMHSSVPRRLYHYTTLGGLQGILKASEIWASDVRYMNDSSELTYARDLIENVFQSVIAEVDESPFKEALPTRSGVASAFEFGARRPFIACFCEQDDLLSQWRGYGATDGSVSLGVDLSIISMVGDFPPNTYLRKVVYERELQVAEVRAVVEAWLDSARGLFSEGLRLDEIFPYPAIWALQNALTEHHLCFKHPTFAEEKEWRLIKLVDVREELRMLNDQRAEQMLAAARERMRSSGVEWPDRRPTDGSRARPEGVEIKFRPSRLGLIPYVTLHLADRAGVFTGRIPLYSVTQGPSANPELGLESLGMYLDSVGYGFHTEVRATGIPLRR